MLTKADVVDLAAEAGLAGADAERAVRNVRPGWRITKAQTATRSRVGGDPDLADGEQWPADADGIPFTFLAQIDCRELPALDAEWERELAWKHDNAFIRVFAALIAEPFDRCEATVLVADPDAAVRRVPRPPVPSPYPAQARNADAEDEQRVYELEEAPIAFTPALNGSHISLPPGHHEHEQLITFDHRLRYDGEPEPDYEDMDFEDEQTRDRPWCQSHLAGCAYPTHDDARYGREPEPEAWTTLVAIGDGDYDGPMVGFGEVTAIQVFIPKADLAEGRYDRLFTDMPMT